MKLNRVVALAALACIPQLAAAQSPYPSKPIRLVVPYAPGGAVDALGRPIAQKLSEQLGQPVIIDNKPGAGSALGADQVARSAPDGYTLLLSSAINYIIPLFQKSVPYDPAKDFTVINTTAIVHNMLAVHPSLPVHSVQELVDYGRKNPGKLFYGTAGIGSTHHIGGIVLARAAGIQLDHVPYKGGSPTINDVLSGSLPMVILTAPTIMPHARSGKLRALGVIEDSRAQIAPDVPAIRDTLRDYHVPDTWFGFLGPANLPRPIVQRLHAEIRKAITAPDVKPRLEGLGYQLITTGTLEEEEARVRRDSDTFRNVVRAAGIRPE
jgi:tripartite-type tricarboxylate transporter receptor subunit TctC